MADILLRGFEMPKNCEDCRLSYSDEYGTTICAACDDCAYSVSCPLVPLPEGHGDLIDRDAFRADYGLGKDCENCDRNTRNCNYDICLSRMDVCGWIDDAPTIVPAEGGGEDG